MVLGVFLQVPAMVLRFVGLLLTSQGREKRRIVRARPANSAELVGPLLEPRSAASPSRADAQSCRQDQPGRTPNRFGRMRAGGAASSHPQPPTPRAARFLTER